MATERDYLKQELGMFLEQLGQLEKENALLSKELQEKKEVEEFESLEEEIRKEHEVRFRSYWRGGVNLVLCGFNFYLFIVTGHLKA